MIEFNCFFALFSFFSAETLLFSQVTDGQDIAVPWILGNTIFAGFIGLVYYLAIRPARRSLSVLDPKKKKKKEKKAPDFSKGPIYHPDLSENIGLTLVGWFTGFPLLFTLPTAKRINEEVKNDPRYIGGGLAQFGVILNYIGVVVAPLFYLTVLGVGIWILIKSLSS